MRLKCRYLFTLGLLLLATTLYAQEGLNITGVFDYYGHRHGSTMVQLSTEVLKSYEMTYYKSLSFRPESTGNHSIEWITACIGHDKQRARKIKETMLDGELKSGYYQLPQLRKDINRFILFKRNGKKATLIYLEGTLSSAELVDLLINKKK